MTPEEREAILAALDELSRSVGCESAEGASSQAYSIFQQLADIFGPLRTRERLRECLDGMQIAPDEFRNLVVCIRYLFQFLGMEAPKFIKQNVPRLRTGGRKHALSPEQKHEVIQQIGSLQMRGATLGTAKIRAAQILGVSRRTVERAWKERAAISGASPQQPTPVEAFEWLRQQFAKDPNESEKLPKSDSLDMKGNGGSEGSGVQRRVLPR